MAAWNQDQCLVVDTKKLNVVDVQGRDFEPIAASRLT